MVPPKERFLWFDADSRAEVVARLKIFLWPCVALLLSDTLLSVWLGLVLDVDRTIYVLVPDAVGLLVYALVWWRLWKRLGPQLKASSMGAQAPATPSTEEWEDQ